MAQIESGSKSGRRGTSLELNLVPFIDLMSVLITFLLITAVWTQVSMIQIGSSLYGKKTENEKTVIPPKADVVLRLLIKPTEYTLIVEKNTIRLPKKDNEYDDLGLQAQLEKAKQLYPEKIDAVIAMSDEMPYEQLIKGMDHLIRAGFTALSVESGAP